MEMKIYIRGIPPFRLRFTKRTRGSISPSETKDCSVKLSGLFQFITFPAIPEWKERGGRRTLLPTSSSATGAYDNPIRIPGTQCIFFMYPFKSDVFLLPFIPDKAGKFPGTLHWDCCPFYPVGGQAVFAFFSNSCGHLQELGQDREIGENN